MSNIENNLSFFTSKEEYFDYVDSLSCEGDRIEYSGDNVIKVNVK